MWQTSSAHRTMAIFWMFLSRVLLYQIWQTEWHKCIHQWNTMDCETFFEWKTTRNTKQWPIECCCKFPFCISISIFFAIVINEKNCNNRSGNSLVPSIIVILHVSPFFSSVLRLSIQFTLNVEWTMPMDLVNGKALPINRMDICTLHGERGECNCAEAFVCVWIHQYAIIHSWRMAKPFQQSMNVWRATTATRITLFCWHEWMRHNGDEPASWQHSFTLFRHSCIRANVTPRSNSSIFRQAIDSALFYSTVFVNQREKNYEENASKCPLSWPRSPKHLDITVGNELRNNRQIERFTSTPSQWHPFRSFWSNESWKDGMTNLHRYVILLHYRMLIHSEFLFSLLLFRRWKDAFIDL